MSSVRARWPRRTTRVHLTLAVAVVVLAAGFAVATDESVSDEVGDLRGDAALASAPANGQLRVVSAGGEHTCGINWRNLYCWGRNTWGQVGNGSRGASVDAPHRIGTRDWRFVSTGGATTCGVRGAARQLWCWGLNNSGQLGNGSRQWSPDPVRVKGGINWALVETGWSHTCAIKTHSQRLYCWGDNSHGQLGRGHTRSSTTPVMVPGRWLRVSTAGWTTCGIRTDRSLWCWGRNTVGQVGDGTRTDRAWPQRIAPPRFASLDLSWTHGCGVRFDGTVRCWGRNHRGQIGDGTVADRIRPARVARIGNARMVGVTEGGSCVVNTEDLLYCWGDNKYDQIGGRWKRYVRPQRMSGQYRYVTSGWLHNCGLDKSGIGIHCWGNDERAQARITQGDDVRRIAELNDTEPAVVAASDSTATSSTAARDPLVFSLATYNVLGENHTGPYRHDDGYAPSRLRAEWTADVFRTHGLDIIGTQEATTGQLNAILKAGHGQYDAYPHPTKDNMSVETSILWDTSQFKALKKRVTWTQFIARKLPRPYIQFQELATGRTFWVMNIHNAPWDYQHKRNLATKLQLFHINRLEETGDPVYYVGDFNEWRNILCKVLRQTDMVSPLGGRLTADGRCLNPKARMRVDWIFGSRETEWHNFHNSKAPMIRLTTDHWVPMVVVRVP